MLFRFPVMMEKIKLILRDGTTLKIKIILLFCLLHMLSLFHSEVVHREGLLLCRFNNLPHRGTGMLFYAQMKNPHRGDFAVDYLANYYRFTGDEFMIEGMKRPVVDLLAIQSARDFPNNPELQRIRQAVMHNHFVRMREESK